MERHTHVQIRYLAPSKHMLIEKTIRGLGGRQQQDRMPGNRYGRAEKEKMWIKGLPGKPVQRQRGKW